MPVRDLIDGQDLDQVLLVREVEARTKRDGAEYLKITFSDRTGTLAAMVWDGVAQVREVCVVGRPIRVVGRFDMHPKYGAQVSIRALRPAPEGSYELSALCPGPSRPAGQMEGDLRELLATVEDPHLRRLLNTTFDPGTESWSAFRVAPAAKHYHQAYVHGLLEHALSVAQAVSAIATTFGGIDRDVAVAGALLHDVGKLEEYTRDPLLIEVTDSGRLHGHIPLGYYRVRRLIEEQPDFPEHTAAALLHIILSHHGSLEHGSPVVPCTREATLVHFVDNLGGRLGAFDRLERELPEGATWSAYDRALGAVAHFRTQPDTEPALATAAGVAPPARAPARHAPAHPPGGVQEALPVGEPQRAAA